MPNTVLPLTPVRSGRGRSRGSDFRGCRFGWDNGPVMNEPASTIDRAATRAHPATRRGALGLRRHAGRHRAALDPGRVRPGRVARRRPGRTSTPSTWWATRCWTRPRTSSRSSAGTDLEPRLGGRRAGRPTSSRQLAEQPIPWRPGALELLDSTERGSGAVCPGLRLLPGHPGRGAASAAERRIRRVGRRRRGERRQAASRALPGGGSPAGCSSRGLRRDRGLRQRRGLRQCVRCAGGRRGEVRPCAGNAAPGPPATPWSGLDLDELSRLLGRANALA